MDVFLQGHVRKLRLWLVLLDKLLIFILVFKLKSHSNFKIKHNHNHFLLEERRESNELVSV